MKKVLLVAPYGGVPGGISRWTGHILDYYKKTGYKDVDMDLVSTGRSMFVNINMPIWERMWFAWKDYSKIIVDFNSKINHNFDVIHLTSSGSLGLYKDLYLIRKAKKCGAKCIVHFRFGRIPELSLKPDWEWKMLVRIAKMADTIVVIDQSSFDTLCRQGFTNVVYLPNPLAPVVEELVEENGENSRSKREILFAGHVVKTKGIFELLEACAQVPDIHLKIVGHITPQMRSEVESIYGTDVPWMTIYGEKPYEEVINDMGTCELFVLPTYTEGFPNVILEAMAARCAIITTPVGAIPEMLDFKAESPVGIEIPVKDVEKLREAIVFGLSHPEEMRRMGESAHEKVLECYSMQKIWSKMLDIWEN